MVRIKKSKKRAIQDNTPSPDGEYDDIVHTGLAAIFSIIIYAIVKAFRSVFKKRNEK
jgi:hypothetical protein